MWRFVYISGYDGGGYARVGRGADYYDVHDPASHLYYGSRLGRAFAGDDATLVQSDESGRLVVSSAGMTGSVPACSGLAALEGSRAALACGDGIRLYDLSDPARTA